MERPANQFVEGPTATARPLVVAGAETPNHRLLRGVPASEQLARTEEARQLMRAAEAPNLAAIPWAVAPEVPAERVAALRQALMDTFADPGFLAEMERATVGPDPNSGEDTADRLAGVVRTRPDILARLKVVLQ